MITGRRASRYFTTRPGGDRTRKGPRRQRSRGRWGCASENPLQAKFAEKRTSPTPWHTYSRAEGPAPAVAGYDSQRNRRRGGPSNMGGQRPDRGAREPVTVAASRRLLQSYPFRGAPASSARHPSGHSRRSTPVLCRADFREPPQYEVRRISLPRTPVNRIGPLNARAVGAGGGAVASGLGAVA